LRALCAAPRVRLLGRIAQEDVDAGDARRVRAMEGPNQSLSLRQNTVKFLPQVGKPNAKKGVIGDALMARARDGPILFSYPPKIHTQFSTTRSGTRRNSRTLLVTKTAPTLRA